MVDYIKVDPMGFPLKKDESWWVIHPNSKGGEFIVPNGACTACLSDLLDFKKGTIYRVYPAQLDGWVCVASGKNMVELPQYLFARHFDAEIFVRGTPTPQEIETVLNPFHQEASNSAVTNPVTGKWRD